MLQVLFWDIIISNVKKSEWYSFSELFMIAANSGDVTIKIGKEIDQKENVILLVWKLKDESCSFYTQIFPLSSEGILVMSKMSCLEQ